MFAIFHSTRFTHSTRASVLFTFVPPTRFTRDRREWSEGNPRDTTKGTRESGEDSDSKAKVVGRDSLSHGHFPRLRIPPFPSPNHSPYTRLIRFLLRSLHPAGAEGGER